MFACKKRNLICYGGAGSGKSVFAADKLAVRSMQEPMQFSLALVKVGDKRASTVFPQLVSAVGRLNAGAFWKINRSVYTLTFLPNGNSIACFGLDDAEKIKSVVDERGVNPTNIWVEEATQVTIRDLEQLNLRMRGRSPSYKQTIVTFNPISEHHPLKRFYFDTPQHGRTRICWTTYCHNRFLDDADRREMDALCERDPHYADIYVRGLWGALGNIIYGGFDMAPWPDVPEKDLYDELLFGLDFGYNNPTALIQCGLRDVALITQGTEYRFAGDVYLRERLYESQLTNADLIARMKLMELPVGAPIYADCAEPARIEELCRAGFNVYPCDKRAGSVLDGITLVKSLHVHTNEWNVNLNEEAALYHWLEDRNGIVLDKPVSMNDHALDGMRYALYTHLHPRMEGEGITVRDLIAEHEADIPVASFRALTS